MIRPSPVRPKLVRCLHGERFDVPPVWLMRQAGRYLPEYRALRARAKDFLDFCYRPELSVEATLQPLRRFELDAAIMFSDILVVPDALGQAVAFEPGRGPVLEPLDGADAVARLSMENLTGHLAPVYEGIARVRESLAGELALIGFAGAPWTLASYMIEGSASKDYLRLKTWAYGGQDGFRALMDKLVDAVIAHLDAQIRAGCDAVQLFDSWAGVLDADGVATYSIAPIRRIAEAIHAMHPEVPVIAFANRIGVSLERFAREAGVDALSIDAGVPLAYAAENLQPLVTVQGNLDPALLVVGGERMRRAVTDILDALGHGPFVFNLGHGIPQQTPPEHVRELVDVVRGGKG